MERREFLTVAGAVAAAHPRRNAEFGMRNELPHGRFRPPHSAFRTAPPQDPTLSREVFARRLARAQQELQARKVDLLIATPGTNYEYLTGYNPGRSERLIALLLPASGDPTIVCPSFEVERIRQHSVIAATFAKLTVGASEREVAQLLSGEMRQRGAEGGGLVQFGPSSALPHGGPGGPTLAREMVVLIDCGCRVGGYTSDITRTTWFGDAPPTEFTKVVKLVRDAP